MQITMRSYLTAGTVAVVGAGAIAMAPVVVDAPLTVPAPAVAEVSLTGIGLSLTDVVGLLQGFGIGGALPDFLTSLPSLLPTDIVTTVVTEFVNQASPLVMAAAGEVFDYLGAAVAGLISGPESIPARFGDALAAIPEAVGAAFDALGSGDLAVALQTITESLAGPVSGIAALLSEAAQSFEEFLSTQLDGLITTLPSVLYAAVQTVLGGNLQPLIDTLGAGLSGLLGGLIPGSGAATVPAAAAAEVGPAPVARAQTELPAAAEVPAAVAPAASVSVEVSAREEVATATDDENPSAPAVSATRARGANTAKADADSTAGAAGTAAEVSDTESRGGATHERATSAKAGAERAGSR